MEEEDVLSELVLWSCQQVEKQTTASDLTAQSATASQLCVGWSISIMSSKDRKKTVCAADTIDFSSTGTQTEAESENDSAEQHLCTDIVFHLWY